MQLTSEELNEFRLEAFEILDQAEKSLLSLDGGGDFKGEYDAIFRAFHNLKGSAGMLDLTAVQAHMHQLETVLTQHKEDGKLAQDLVDYFLKGCDEARGLFDRDFVATPLVAPTPSRALQIESVNTLSAAVAPTPVNVSNTVPSTDLLIHYYRDLDNYYQIKGDEVQRSLLQRQVFELMQGSPVVRK